MSSQEQKSNTVVDAAIGQWARVAGGLMPLLHAIQKQNGFIPKASVATIAKAVGLSRAEVHGVIGFYHDFGYKPQARTTIQVCRAEACQAMGSQKLEDHIKSRLGINFDETTDDGQFSLKSVYCLGNCACTPCIRIADEVYARVDAERFDEILDEVSV
jgi:formate dehydrogenase subunit gamma